MIYSVTCFFLRILFRILFAFKIYNLENIPKTGSFIIASNHISHLDPIAVGAFVPRNLNYIGKKELFKNRYFGWYMRKVRVIPIDRDSLAYGTMKGLIRKIQRGEPLVIFPEGTRSNGNSFLEPEMGVGWFALKFNLPVIPAYVEGTGKALPKGARFIRLNPVRTYYGKPKKYQMPAGSTKDEAYMEVSKKIMEEIKALKIRHEKED